MGQGDSKQRYNKAVKQLIDIPNLSSSDISFWSQFWSLPTSPDEVFAAISPEDVRKIKHENPANLANLLTKAVGQLTAWVQRISSADDKTDKTSSDYVNALNCIRLITRILPLLFEDQSDSFVEHVFWRNLPPKAPAVAPPSATPPAASGGAEATTSSPAAATVTTTSTTSTDGAEAVSTESAAPSSPAKAASSPEGAKPEVPPVVVSAVSQEVSSAPSSPPHPTPEDQIPVASSSSLAPSASASVIRASGDQDLPLAIRLLNTLVQLLFTTNFTVAPLPAFGTAAVNPKELPEYHFWMAGLGSENAVYTPNQMWAHRNEVLKCLIACFSETLYLPPQEVFQKPNRWIEHLVARGGYYSYGMFCSLINVACTYDPVGWGIPYNHIMLSDNQEGVAVSALEVLNVFFQYRQCPNIFLTYLAGIKRQKDHVLLINAFERLMKNSNVMVSSRLPYSIKQIDWPSTVLIFFWQLVEVNQKFLEYFLKSERCPIALTPMLCAMHDGRVSLASLGIIQLSTFVLLLLSGERDFAVSLNKTVTEKIQNFPSFVGTYADFLITVICKIITDSRTLPHFLPIQECLLTVLANISPFIKNIGMGPATSLVKVFESLSHPRVLFSSEHIFRLVHLILEFLNNIIQYQFEGNSALHYAVLRFQNDFSKLVHLKILPPPQAPPPSASTNALHVENQIGQVVTAQLAGEAGGDAAKSDKEVDELRRSSANTNVEAAASAKTAESSIAAGNANVQAVVDAVAIASASEESTNMVPVSEPVPVESEEERPQTTENEDDATHEIKLNDGEEAKSAPTSPAPEHSDKSASEQPDTPLSPVLPPTPPPSLEPSAVTSPVTPPHSLVPSAHSTLATSSVLAPPSPFPELNPFSPRPNQSVVRALAASDGNVAPGSTLRNSVTVNTLKASQHAPGQVFSSAPSPLSASVSHQFIPTAEWLDAWKRFLPLDNILRVITILSPQVQTVCVGSSFDESLILGVIQKTTLVGLLPPPHPILVRRYQSNEATVIWLLSYLWGTIFLQQASPPLFNGTLVKLFVLASE